MFLEHMRSQIDRCQPSRFDREPPGTGIPLPVGKILPVTSRYSPDPVQKYLKPHFHVTASLSDTQRVCDAWLLWVQCLWMVDVMYLGIIIPPPQHTHISSREILPMVVWVAWFDRDFGVGRLKMDVVISRTGYPPGPRFWNRAFC